MGKLDDIFIDHYGETISKGNIDDIEQQIKDMFMKMIDDYSDDIEKLYDKVNEL